MKNYYRCIVCGDMHYGASAPKLCPTCMQENVYVQSESKEFKLVTESIPKENHSELENEWNYDIIKEKFETLCTKNGNFILNPDSEHTDMLLNGAIKNQKDLGTKKCPCRFAKNKDDFEEEINLICPCNFFQHDTYKEKKRDTKQCWCGLFIKKE